ncbi:MAG: inner membrane protein [Blastocatellia bacterium]|jgi:inner membrane protein|nr:inner membrane protein [Blastocatellia bacterium]
MDNLTHSLVGLAAAKAGLERWSPAATIVCVLAANAPDADILSLLGGRWAYLQHHRGITHSIVGTLVLALLVPLLFYLGDLIIARARGKPGRVRLRGLLFASLIVSATHPLMDWTNNYGLRPWLPWSAEWYYGDLVFIVDPWLWLSLGGAAFLLTARGKWRTLAWAALALVVTLLLFVAPQTRTGLTNPLVFRLFWLTGLAAFALAHYKQTGRRVGSSLAVIALALIVVYWGGLSIAHHLALARAQAAANNLATQHGETLKSVAAMPTLANPASWQCVAETDRAVYRYDLSLWERGEAALNDKRYEKPTGCEAEAVARAAQDERAKVFLGFARYPLARVQGGCLSQSLVQFADLRYTEPGARGSGSFALEILLGQPPQAVETDKTK